MPTFLRRLLYIVLGLLGFILLLVIGLVVALQVPSVQDFAARKAAGYLQGKIGTEVRIQKFRTDWRHALSLDGVYLEDQQGDTLVSVGHLGVDIDLWGLLSSEINVSALELDNGTVHITRTLPDSTFNFDYITQAFATADTAATAPADTTGGFTYNIGDVRLNSIYFTYEDQVEGMNVRSRVGELAVNMEEVNVDKSIYRVDNAALRRAAISIVQTKVPPETPSEPLTLTFGINKVNLDSVSLSYRNAPSAQYIETRIGQAEATADNIDLINARVDLNTLTLKNSSLVYAQNKDVPTEQRVVNPAEAVRKLNESVEKTTGDTTSWVVTLDKSDISGLAVKFDNFNEPKQQTRVRGMDYNHLDFTDLKLNTTNLFYSENRTTGRINELAGKEQSGFEITHAEADVVFDSVQTRLDNLDLVTPHTRIRRTLAMGYESLDALANTDKLGQLRIEGDLRDVRLGFRDILYLAPELASEPPFNTGPNQSVLLSGQINGRVGDFYVRNLEFVGFRNTQLVASGRIQGLPETDRRLYVDLDIKKFTSTAADIKSLVPAGTIPSNIQLPASMSVAGTFRGRPTAQVFDANLRANTSFGSGTAKVNVGAGPVGQEPVSAVFDVQNFDVGKLLRDPTIGKITASGRLNGRGGLNPDLLRGKLSATVQKAEYQGYTYRGIEADVDIDRNRYVVDARSRQDPNLNLDVLATIDLRDPNNPTYNVEKLNLRGANLTALGFYTGGDLRVQGDLTANLSGSDANSLNGTFSGSNIVIVRDNVPIAIDSINGRIVQRNGRADVDITSSVADVQLRGNTPLGDLATVLQQHIDRYFDLPGVQYRPGGPMRQFTFDINLKDPRVATKFVPDLTTISPFRLTGSFDSQTANLQANAKIAHIVYTGFQLDSLRFDISSDPEKLDYAVKLRRAAQDTTLVLPNPRLVGSVANNRVNTDLRIAESDSTVKLALTGVLQVIDQGDAYAFSFGPNFVLDNQRWEVAPNNEVRYAMNTGAIRAENVRLSNGNQLIELQTLPGAEYPLQARLSNIDVNQLAKAGGLQDSLVGGTLNGEAVVRSLGQPRQAFTADMTLKDFMYSKSVIGDIALQATNPSPDRYNLDARLTGGPVNNDVRVSGYYLAAGELNMTADVTRLGLKTAEPFALGEVQDMSGFLSGQLAITGTTAAPQIRGRLNTNQAGFRVTQLGSPFTLPDESIVFDAEGIQFSNFTILDSLGNKAVVNGSVLTQNYVDDYRFQLRATTNDFLAVNSTAQDNPLYYGKLIVDSDTRITGDLNLPIVRTKASVEDGSALTFVVPNEDAGLVEREGIVVFVDKSAPLDTMLARQVPVDSAKTAAGFDVSATVTVTDKTPFTIVIDEAAGDNLKVRAAGTLEAGIDPAGTITMNGRLRVTDGSYHMSLYDLTERDFAIAEGSTILWTGDPYNAQLNVTAIYNVKAAAAELLAGQGNQTLDTKTEANNKLPFQVMLNVRGEMLKPEIGFDIQLPEGEGGAVEGQVRAKLASLRTTDQNGLNKQVFSLLVLGRFMTENPFESSGGNIVADQLRGSASKVLTDQLNNLTGDYLSNLGIELGVDSYADYSSGAEKTRTDLNVAVRQQFFNDRLSVKLGTDVPLAGGNPAVQGQNSASQLAGDVRIEYSIMRDGRLRLQAFRNNSYGDIDGQFVRTGVSLIFQRDYQNLADLLKGMDELVKARRKANKEVEKQEEKREEKRQEQRADSVQNAAVLPRRSAPASAAPVRTAGQ